MIPGPGPARPPSPRAPWGRPAPLLAAAVALALAANLPALRGGFFFADDLGYVAENPALLETPLSRPWRFFAGRTNPWEYLPIRDLSYRIDLALFGLSPRGFLATNLALYGLACVACFVAARAIVRLLRGPRGDLDEDVIVVAAAALFAVHPAHVESVAWISGRKDLLSGLFALLSLWQLALALAPDRPSPRRVGAAAALFALALLSKSAVLPLAPLAVLLAAARFREAPLRSALARALAVTAPLTVVAIASAWLFARASTVYSDATPDLASRVGTALRILGTLAHVTLAPFRLRFHYDVQVPGAAGAALLVAGVATATAGALGAWALVRRGSIAGFGAAAFALFTAPVLQLVPFQAWSEASERFVFTASMGIALAAGVLAARAAARLGPGVAAAAVALVFAAGVAGTALRSAEWESFDRLVSSSVARSPTHPQAVVLGVASLAPGLDHARAREAASALAPSILRERLLLLADGWQALAEGRGGDARRVADALSSLPMVPTAAMEGAFAEQAGADLAAVRLYAALEDQRPGLVARVRERSRPRIEALERLVAGRPGDVGLLLELGNLQSELLLDADAERTYRGILALAPDLPAARYNLGVVLRRRGAWTEAAGEFRLATRGVPRAWNELGTCERALGNLPGAVAAFRNALAAEPGAWKPAYNLALAHERLGQLAEARAALRVARDRAAVAGSPADRALVEALGERLAR